MNNSMMDISFRFRQLNKMQALTLCRELDSASYTEHSADEAGTEITVNEKNTKPRNYSALVILTPENIEAITMFYVRQGINLSQCDILINATLTNTTSFTLPVIVNQMLKHIDCPISFFCTELNLFLSMTIIRNWVFTQRKGSGCSLKVKSVRVRFSRMDEEQDDNSVIFDSSQAFRLWLELYAATATELLVGFYKVTTDKPCMSWSESVDEALCFGWIDGKRKRIDEQSYSIRFTPRKKSSIWSQINIDKIADLRAQGRMTAAGELAFSYRTEQKSAVYSHEQATVASLSAEELQIFQSNAAAWSFFASTPPGYQKVLLHWICSAKKAETRLSRLAKLMEASEAGKKCNSGI